MTANEPVPRHGAMVLLSQIGVILARGARALWRQPETIPETLVSPVLWLYLFASAFARMKEIPRFPAPDYLTFSAAGVIGIFLLDICSMRPVDVILDRFSGHYAKMLVFPVSRPLVLLSSVLVLIPRIAFPALLLLMILFAGRVDVAAGLGGAALILVLAVLCGFGFACLGVVAAMVSPGEGEFFGLATLFKTLIVFLTYTVYPESVTPDWFHSVARYNPLTYLVVPARRLMVERSVDWAEYGFAVLALTVFGAGAFMVSAWVFSRTRYA